MNEITLKELKRCKVCSKRYTKITMNLMCSRVSYAKGMSTKRICWRSELDCPYCVKYKKRKFKIIKQKEEEISLNFKVRQCKKCAKLMTDRYFYCTDCKPNLNSGVEVYSWMI